MELVKVLIPFTLHIRVKLIISLRFFSQEKVIINYILNEELILKVEEFMEEVRSF